MLGDLLWELLVILVMQQVQVTFHVKLYFQTLPFCTGVVATCQNITSHCTDFCICLHDKV